MSNSFTGKFVVGNTLVTVRWTPTNGITATDGEEEWTPTIEQIKEQYTAVSDTAERFPDLINAQKENNT